MKARKFSHASKEGEAAGAWLADRAPRLLLAEYGERPVDKESPAAKRFSTAIDALRSAVAHDVSDPRFSKALHRLDAAVWQLVVEYEDRAWHAAWTVAMRLKRGR